jgi:uncharacterized protein YdaU (DUF1376 family)
MSLHIGDYKKDTSHLRASGHGAYLLLTMHYWATGGLPHDDDQLAAIACLTDKEWKKLKPTLKALFKAGEWKHKRIDEELAEAQALYEKRSRAGSNGNAKRWGSPGDGKCDRPAIPKQSQPITDNRKDGDGGDARARDGLISPEAHSLAVKVATIAGFPDIAGWPPGWCGAPLTAQKWINEGWPHEIVIAACRESMGKKRDGPPNSINYFEKSVARAIAQHAQPLPKVVIENTPEIIHANNEQPADWKSSRDNWRRAVSEFGAAVDAIDGAAGSGGQGST